MNSIFVACAENPQQYAQEVVGKVLRLFPRTKSGKGWFIFHDVVLYDFANQIVHLLFEEHDHSIAVRSRGGCAGVILEILQSKRARHEQSQQNVATLIHNALYAMIDPLLVQQVKARAVANIITAIRDTAERHQMACVIPHEAAMNTIVDNATSLLFGDEEIRLLLDRRNLQDSIIIALLKSRTMLNNQDRSEYIASQIAPLVPCA